MRLANNWNSYEVLEYRSWSVGFPLGVTTASLLAWQDLVLAAGERHQILRVDEAECFGYSRLRDGPFSEFVHAHPERLEPPNDVVPVGFVLNRIDGVYNGIRTSTLLDFVDADGELAQDWISCMSELGRRVGLGESYPNEPFSIAADSDPEAAPPVPATWAEFSVTTDIFFPWVQPPLFHRPRNELRDNMILARLNGSRLNGFLRDVCQAALEIGGVWEHPRQTTWRAESSTLTAS